MIKKRKKLKKLERLTFAVCGGHGSCIPKGRFLSIKYKVK